MKNRTFLVQHLLPLLFALIISVTCFFFNSTRHLFFPLDHPEASIHIPDTSVRTYVNYNGGYSAELNIRNAFQSGSPIVLFGSSELARPDLTAIPYNFFRNTVKFPCIAMGHAGNQSLSMAVQLAALHEDLSKAKLVFMISPGWFFGTYAAGTSVQSFLEFANEHFLYRIWNDPEVSHEFKDQLADYVVAHFKDIDSPSSILRLIYYSRTGDLNIFKRIVNYPFIAAHKAYTGFKTELMDKLFENGYAAFPYSTEKRTIGKPDNAENIDQLLRDPNWDSLMADALEQFAKQSDNNSFGVENAYFNQHVRDLEGKKHVDPPSIQNSTEFKDLCLLLSLVKHLGGKPLFIIQPLNPLTHDDLHILQPTLNRITEELKKNGFEYYNMYDPEIPNYIKGTLADVMHMGNYGWLKADKKIMEYFFTNKTGK